MPESSVAECLLFVDSRFYRLTCASCQACLFGSLFFVATEDGDLFAKVRWEGSRPESQLKAALRDSLLLLPVVVLVAILCSLRLLSATMLTIILWSLWLVAIGVPSTIFLFVAYLIFIYRDEQDHDVANGGAEQSA